MNNYNSQVRDVLVVTSMVVGAAPRIIPVERVRVTVTDQGTGAAMTGTGAAGEIWSVACGSNNCLKFGSYYHPKDDCCERPSSSVSRVTRPVYSSDSVSVLSQWGSWSSWSSCSTRHQQVGGRCRRIRTRQCQGQGCRASQDLQVGDCYKNKIQTQLGILCDTLTLSGEVLQRVEL